MQIHIILRAKCCTVVDMMVMINCSGMTQGMTGRDAPLPICTFAGHSLVCAPYIEQRLENEIEAFLSDIDKASFYVGGRGEFDGMAAAAVRAAKARHRDKKIQLYLIEPYFHAGINRDKEFYEQMYDGIIILQELLGVHPKAAILKCNRWMCDQADCLIAFVCRDFGGAYQTLKYAKRKGGIRIINLAANK